ncbi:MAG: PorT family protein [Bacteroidales bacterium]|nr:PorT family protein [Bacteroidales bacterium]
MNFLNWYKNKIESNELDPPGNTWDNIQDKLDIDSSWQAIDKHLDNRARFISRLRVSAAASLLVLAMAGAGWLYFGGSYSGKQEAEPQIAEKENIITEDLEARTAEARAAEARPQEEVAVEEQPVGTQYAEASGMYADAGTEEEEAEVSISEALHTTSTTGEMTERPEPLFIQTGRSGLDLADIPGTDHLEINPAAGIMQGEKKGKARKAFRKLYAGSTGQLANTWLINQKTISGFKSTSLVTTNASFGSNFGIFAGTNLLNNVDLQMDFNILARNTQDYNEYLNGHFVSNKLKLDYSQLALSFRYYIISPRFMEGEHGVNVGAYMGYLHDAYQKINGETRYLSGNYSNVDYGLLLGYEYIFPLHGQLGLGTGFRAYYGLNNIYSGDENIPAYLNITNTASVNITLSLKYLIK